MSQHLDLLKLLLPPESYDPQGKNLGIELNAEANALDLAAGKAAQLLLEMFAASTSSMLSDWERVYGLPESCLIGIAQSFSARRFALVSKIMSEGGTSRAYYIRLAAALGFTITITEFREHTVEDNVEHPVYDQPWEYAWQVNSALNTIYEMTVEDSVEDPLQSWGNELLECYLSRLKPANTVVIFAYS
ncbi:MAG TPA: putative phage tail protein [Methylophilaceae bacterium]|nr:putative phage tail protein [Methylophilaceae bacterium]